MTENANTQEVKPEAKTLDEFLKLTKFPEPALKPVTDKVAEHNKLVVTSNKLVAQINAAKATDPSNTEYLDSLWRSLYTTNPEMVEIEANYQALVDESEKLLAKLRAFAKTNIPESLSEDKAKDAKKTVNEMAPVISESRKAIAAMLAMPESMLTAFNVAIPEGGLVSLLPSAESLKNVRGRAAATATGNVGSNMTRVGEVLIDGTSTNIDGKGKFNYAANTLTEKFNGKVIAENKVTAEELEEAYWKATEKPFRSIPSTQLPLEVEFTFEKTIKVQNSNDDGFKEVPQKVKVLVRNPNYGKAVETPAPETTTETKTESKPAETKVEKIDTRTVAQKKADAEKASK